MLAAPSRDSNVFTQIFADHWEPFQRAHPRYQTAYYDGLVAKRRACGNPEPMGYVAYRGLPCGQGKPLVAMRCTSSLCWRCAKVTVDNWGSQVSTRLHEGGISRHIILTVPAMFRTPFSQHAAVVLSAFMRCGAQGLDDFSRTVRGKALKGGSLTVLHTHGRNGQYPPHLQLLATRGGYDAEGARWEHLQSLPYDLLRRKWPWHLLTLLRQTRKTAAVKRWGEACFRQYPDGLVTKVQKGALPSQSQRLARYVAQDVVSPPIAVRRIDRYDGARVTYPYRSHRTERLAHETVTVETCIGRMVQHTVPKGFKRIRYDGVPATKTFAKGKVAMQAALAKVEGLVKGAVQILARLTYRQRYEQSTGRDPLVCPHCQSEMGVWRIWHPTYGVIYDEGEVIKRGTYTSSAQRAGP
ncbi:MAG TPA: transposase [Candidatus Saccharimonadia bacterium]|nr:transposase [Candidatus Saccharimonadia bacterium]